MKYIGHGGKEIVERVLPPIEAKKRIKELKRIAITDRVARECIDLAYGFFTPLQGFMGKKGRKTLKMCPIYQKCAVFSGRMVV